MRHQDRETDRETDRMTEGQKDRAAHSIAAQFSCFDIRGCEMRKNAILSLCIVTVGIFIMAGVLLLTLMLANGDRDGSMRMILNSGESRSISFEESSFYPSKSSSFDLTVHASVSGRYRVELEFSGDAQNSLPQYIDVELRCGKNTLYRGSLARLLTGEKISFAQELSRKKGASIQIIYTMSDDADDSLQSCSADFEMLISASNSEDLYE